MQTPNHRHRQTQDQNVRQKVRNRASNAEANQIHTLRIRDLLVPEGSWRPALEDARK